MADLRHGGGFNGGYKLLWGTTVLGDGSTADTHDWQCRGQDWYFQFPGDAVTDAVAGDIIETKPPAGGLFRRRVHDWRSRLR